MTSPRHILYMCSLCLWLGARGALAQEGTDSDWVLLRDLQVMRAPIAAGSAAGIQFAAGDAVGWEQVLQVQAAAIRPEQARDFLQRVGLPAARVRWRLEIGDWRGAGDLSGSLLAGSGDEPSETQGLLWLAQMAALRAEGRGSEALQAYLQVLGEFAGQPAWQQRLPRSLELPASLEQDPFRLLPPLWLDAAGNTAAWTEIAGQLESSPAESRSLMELVYLLSLAVAVRQEQNLPHLLEQVRARSDVWHQVLELQRGTVQNQTRSAAERQAAWQTSESWPELPQGLARYWVALGQLRDPAEDFERASLRMLSVAASLGTTCPELSAAAIAAVATATFQQHDQATARKLVRELKENYSTTWTARHWSDPPITPNEKQP